MSAFIDTGTEERISLAAGHSLVFYVFRDGEATLRVESGLPGAPYTYGKYTTKGQQTIGPFATACVLRLHAAQQDVEFDSGAAPSVTGDGGGGGLPGGGTTGQTLIKNSATDGDASWQTPPSGNVVEVLDAGLSQIDVTCTVAATNYQAYEFPLTLANLPAESVLEFECQIHWAALAATLKTMLIGIGRDFATAMTGSASNVNGALILSRTNSAVQNTSEFKVRVQVGTNRDVQAFIFATNGDENTGTSSILPVGAVTISANDCKLYLGLKSATAGEVLRCSSRLVTRIKVPV